MSAKAATAAPGFRCPRCHTRTRVRSTAPRADGTVTRYRYCPVCPYHVKTTEQQVRVDGK